MGVSTGTYVKFYTKEKELINNYDLNDRSDDYVYDGLVCDGGASFSPENYGDFTEDEKEIMKIYFDEKSLSVSEGHAKVVSNIQSPDKLLPIWIKIRSSIIKPFQSNLNDYHNQIVSEYNVMNENIIKHNNSKRGIFPKKVNIDLNNKIKIIPEYKFKDNLWITIWQLDSISRIIGLLIVAKENKMMVEITACDY